MFDLPDDEILSLSKEHVFWTWSAQAKVNPIPVKRAKGVYFWDVNDKRYLDFNSMTMCVNIGHGDERVIEAMVNQARELPYTAPGMTNKVRALASKLVAEVSPQGQLTKVLVHAWRRGRKRERHQAGARLYRTLQNFGTLSFVSWRVSGRDGCDRRSAAGGLGADADAGRRSFP